jgi:membrane-bound lytic murein transglycosylase D
MLKVLEQCEEEYEKGVEFYNNNLIEKSRKSFKKVLRLLSSSAFEQNFLYDLSDEFNYIFQNLNQRLNLIQTENGLPHKVVTPPIPIDENDPAVQKHIEYFTNGGKKSLTSAFENMEIYREIITSAIEALHLPLELLYLPIVESRYEIKSYSSAKAAGLWQFMKHTSRGHNMRVDFWIDERLDPEKSTWGALGYLKELYYYFNDWNLALSGYNRGENGIGRDLYFSKATDFSKLAEQNAIPLETENYIPKFMAVVIIARNLEKYGFKLTKKSPLRYDVITTDKMIDLEIAAKCAETTKKEIQRLNPAILAWCTPKNYPDFKLKIPYGCKEIFIKNLEQISDVCPSREFVKYRIKKGDYLGKIASLYKTSVSSIKNDNQINDVHKLMPGQVLIIKPGRKYYQ